MVKAATVDEEKEQTNPVDRWWILVDPIFFGFQASNQPSWCRISLAHPQYPLVNFHITMENHHVQWVNPLFPWAIFNSYFDITRGYV